MLFQWQPNCAGSPDVRASKEGGENAGELNKHFKQTCFLWTNLTNVLYDTKETSLSRAIISTNLHLAIPSWIINPALSTSVDVHVSVCAHHIGYACWPQAAVLSPSSVFWVMKRRLEHKMKKKRQQAPGRVFSLNWSSPLSRRCTMCAYVLAICLPCRAPPSS